MDLASHGSQLSAIVTLLALVFYFYTALGVGAARTKYNVPAPGMTGNPMFERAMRVQMNTLEAMPIFLPALWLATIYFTKFGWLPAAVGLVWIVGRFLYMTGYMADPGKRSTGFLIALVAQLVLVLLTVAGIYLSW
jgi:glutathione S-transferase